MKKSPFILLILMASTFASFAQTKRAFLKEAENAYASKNYYSALNYFQEAFEFDSTDVNVIYKIAESARALNAYGIADSCYTHIANSEDNSQYPTCKFWLGEIHKRMGNYDKAESYYGAFVNERSGGSDDYFAKKARLELNSMEWARAQISAEPNYALQHMGTEVNTTYSEFAPVVINGELYYSALKFLNPKDEHEPTRHISKVLKYDTEGSSSEIVDNPFNDEMLHTGNVAVNQEGTLMYFTLCNYITDADLQCKIYSRAINEDGSFGERTLLPVNINNEAATNTHPSVGLDLDGNTVLYFASDRAGGKGKRDIWYATINGDGTFGAPINFDKVNTFDDEVTPFYHFNTDHFYFASMGHKGLGGYDVFKTSPSGSKWNSVENLGKPVNSTYNDLYYYLSEGRGSGYLASNRVGSYFLKDAIKACCYDLYMVEGAPMTENLVKVTPMNRNIVDALDLSEYKGRNVELLVHEGPKNGTFDLNQDGTYTYTPNRDYVGPDRVTVLKCYDGFSRICDTTYIDITVLPIPVDTIYRSTPENTPLEDCFDLSALKGQPNFEMCKDPRFGKLEIADDGCWKYIPNKDFIGKDEFCVMICDEHGNCVKKIVKIDVIPAITLEELIPVELYFDNDQPDPKTKSTSTNTIYKETYQAYYARKPIFIQKYTGGLTGQKMEFEKVNIDQFFEQRVKKGQLELETFTGVLFKYLKNDQEVEIVLKGYTSPRANPDYNLNLAKRRIQCLRNHFTRWNGGAFNKYVKNGQLIISEVAFGETEAPAGISDQYLDERNSIYSPGASLERRIEIIEVKR